MLQLITLIILRLKHCLGIHQFDKAYRQRYYEFLTTFQETMGYDEWVHLDAYYVEGVKLDVLKMHLFPNTIREVHISESEIRIIEIDAHLPLLHTLEFARCKVNDVVGLINLPSLNRLNAFKNRLFRFDHMCVPKDMEYINLGKNPLPLYNA